jgi:hypothetical protein
MNFKMTWHFVATSVVDSVTEGLLSLSEKLT